MHTLNITGETPEALYFNVMKTLSLFLQGATAPVSSPQANTASEVGVSRSASDADVAARSEPNEDEKTTVLSPKARKNAKADKVEKLPSDPLPDSMSGANTIEHDPKEVDGKPAAKELTLAGDIIPRLQAIQAACTKRGMSMPDCVAFIQKLYGPFGIANAKQLKSEQFEEFLEASDAYLKGEA